MQYKKHLAVFLTCCLVLCSLSLCFAAGTPSDSLNQVVAYYQNHKTTLDSWEEVVGLRGAGIDVSTEPWTLPDWGVEYLNAASQPSDYASTILGMLAAGLDPSNIPGRNLVSELAAMQASDGSFNGPINQTIWAIIALDTAKANYDESNAVAYLISRQKGDGGFALVGSTGDPDTTGMALIALAAHPRLNEVDSAITEALNCLKTLQLNSGGFAYGEDENCESNASVIRGLVACGEDVTADGWQKNNHTMVEVLLSFQQADGSFAHINGGGSDSMATRQAMIALGDLANGDVFYNLRYPKPVKSTVQLRVEGASNNLADKTITVAGTALDALKAAVGNDQVVVNGSSVASIKGESGHTGVAADTDTGWFYYVIRNGSIDEASLSTETGSYNIQTGDQIIFYIGAYGHTTYAPKTYYPIVNISPQSPSAGQTITINISAKKKSGGQLEDLTADEAAAVGNYTFAANGTTYTSQFGQVTIPDIPAGSLNYSITNQNVAGYPNVVPYRNTINVETAVNSSVRVRVEGAANNLADTTVRVTGTALDALLAAVGSGQVVAPGGFITSIKGESGHTNVAPDIDTAWFYYVIRNDSIDTASLSAGANSYNIQNGDQIIFYIGAYGHTTYAPMTYYPIISISPPSPTAGQTVTINISAKKSNWGQLEDLTAAEAAAIGNYTFVANNTTYTSQFGQVSIPNIAAGSLSYTITNQNPAGYPHVVPYRNTIDVGTAVKSSVRVRVEGAASNLADTTVSVIGTALDALIQAVGSDQVVAPGGFITSIKGESGHTGITPDTDTGWFYYVIRNDSIDVASLSSGAGNYNIRNGDQIVFYIGAYGHTDYAPKTYYPIVSISPQSPRAGETITIDISAKKSNWGQLEDLTAAETLAIGNYTVVANGVTYTSQSGQVTIANVHAGTLSYSITNQNSNGYPDVVPFRDSIVVAKSGGTTGFYVQIAVRDKAGNRLFGPGSVNIPTGSKYGYTPLGALDATGLSYTISSRYSGFVDSIAGIPNSGTEGWMYAVNDGKPNIGADKYTINQGDRVLWWYGDASEQPPAWSTLLTTLNTPAARIQAALTDLKAGKTSLVQAIDIISTEVTKLTSSDLDPDLNNALAEVIKVISELVRQLPSNALNSHQMDNEAVMMVNGDAFASHINALSKAATLSLKLKALGIQDANNLIVDGITVNVDVKPSSPKGYSLTLPAYAAQLLSDNNFSLTLNNGDTILSLPPEVVKTVLTAASSASQIKISAVPVTAADLTTLNGAALVEGKGWDLNIAVVTAAGKEQELDAQLGGNITITLSLDDLDASRLELNKPAVYSQDQNGSWQNIGGTLSSDNKAISFVTDHTMIYALLEYSPAFQDIKGHWAESDIEQIYMMHIAAGVGGSNFLPDQEVTRAQFAVFLVNALGLKPVSQHLDFIDVASDYWGCQAIQTAADAGLISGVGAARFEPDREITRQEMACLIVNALQKYGTGISLPDDRASTVLEKYVDREQVSGWAENNLSYAVDHGIMAGRTATTIDPLGRATRAEAVVLLKKLLQSLKRL